jgi:addiction module RelB/DinJ family antitoxin
MKTIINIKVDREVKDQIVEIAKEMGVPLSTIANAFFKKLIKERSFTITAPLVPTKELEKILIKARKNIREGKNLSPSFTDADSIMKYLQS